MDPSIAVALITSATGIVIALIGAYASSGKAVKNATDPLNKEIARLRELVVSLDGDPDVAR